MRLIDTDKLLENIKSGDPLIFEKSIENQIKFAINQQPTAYDVDRVVEQAEDIMKDESVRFVDQAVHRFVNIVKAGGINENS